MAINHKRPTVPSTIVGLNFAPPWTYRSDDRLWSQEAGRHGEVLLVLEFDGNIRYFPLHDRAAFEAMITAVDTHLDGEVSGSGLAKDPFRCKHRKVPTANGHAIRSLQTVCEC